MNLSETCVYNMYVYMYIYIYTYREREGERVHLQEKSHRQNGGSNQFAFRADAHDVPGGPPTGPAVDWGFTIPLSVGEKLQAAENIVHADTFHLLLVQGNILQLSKGAWIPWSTSAKTKSHPN